MPYCAEAEILLEPLAQQRKTWIVLAVSGECGRVSCKREPRVGW